MVTNKSQNLELNYFKGFLLVFTAGLLWSFGAVVVRHMVDANNYQAQYLF